MGQMLLRELGDICKRLEQEKTQRCFVQGCRPCWCTVVNNMLQCALRLCARVHPPLAHGNQCFALCAGAKK